MKKITLIIMILGMITISNAQIEKIELKLTPEIEEKMLSQIKDFLGNYCTDCGITDKSQLENLHIGKPIPNYWIESDVNRMVGRVTVDNMSRIDEEPSLRFMDTWNVPVMFDETPLLFVIFAFSDEDPYLVDIVRNTIEHVHNYEHKDSIIGYVSVSGKMDYLIIRKENQDIFVQIYGEITGEYFNEYSLSELINHLKELNLREKEARKRRYDKIANKSELELTPEITEMLVARIQNMSETFYSNYGVKNRAQLDNLQFEKPIPLYVIENESLKFTGRWRIPVLSDGEPLFLAHIKIEDDGQCSYQGKGAAIVAESIHNYEHKDLIIGFLGVKSPSGMDYLIIRKENQDIFVQRYDYATRENFKNEYSLSELINLIKK